MRENDTGGGGAAEPLDSYGPISRRAQREWRLWGPNSGGGESVCLVDGLVYWVCYGDAAEATPDGPREVQAVLTPAEFVARFGDVARFAEAVADLAALADGA